MVQLVSMLRTTENKIYRQGIQSGSGAGRRLSDAPRKPVCAIRRSIIGSVDANYFTPAQQQLIRQFVDRRGGGLLMVARPLVAVGRRLGRVEPGGSPAGRPPEREGHLPCRARRRSRRRRPAPTASITRLDDDPGRQRGTLEEAALLDGLPGSGHAQARARRSLAEMFGGGRKMPLLVTENYGHGRTAVLGSRRHVAMADEPAGRRPITHDLFWQQLIRWLVVDAAGPVAASVPKQVLFDDDRIVLSAEVRGKDYQPVSDARVEAHVIGPSGVSANLDMTPVPDAPGSFQAEWTAAQPGSYLTEGDGDPRRRTSRPRRPDVPAHGRRGGELPHQPEPRSARPSVVPDRRPLLASSGSVDACRRHRVFGGGRHDARDAGPLEHAGGLPADPLAPRAPNGCCGANGGSYENTPSPSLSCVCGCRRRLARTLLRHGQRVCRAMRTTSSATRRRQRARQGC